MTTPLAAEQASGTARTNPTHIGLSISGGPVASFRLLWEDAPETCAAVVKHVPSIGECVHAIYSGTMVGFFFDPTVAPPVENATTCVLPGDLLFTHYHTHMRHGYPDPLTEIYWAYDRYAKPTVPGQFVSYPAPVFATFDGEQSVWQQFAESSRASLSASARVDVSLF